MKDVHFETSDHPDQMNCDITNIISNKHENKATFAIRNILLSGTDPEILISGGKVMYYNFFGKII